MRGLKNSIQTSSPKKIILPKIRIIQEEEDDNQEINEEDTNKNDNSKISFSDISEKFNENDDNAYMEKQLSLLLEVFLTTFEKKTYLELIKDIEEKEILLCQNSIMSFKIMILKVRCLIKILLEEYNHLLRFKNANYHELDNTIQKIQNEFNKISNMIISNNSYEYEILSQAYCKFLYLLSKISLKKEDNIKSLGFISLGINILKVFMIKKGIANDIGTYKIYSKLLLVLINTLIGDSNYEAALLYSRLLIKVIEISLKYIYSGNYEKNNENKSSILISKKFIKYAGYAFLYIGCCLEQFDEDVQALEAYKQANFLLEKGSLTGNPFKNINIVSINNSCNYLAMELFEKLNLKLQKEKIDRMQKQNKLEELKKKREYQLLKNEKQIKLKLISNGYIGNPFKFNKLEEKIDKLLFPTSIQKNLDKIDDELMSFVFTYYNKNRDKTTLNRNKMSVDTKKIISRYELYNILMSKDFRDFVMKHKKLQFNNPKKGSESISTIQRYLNKKMEIKFLIKQRHNTHKKTIRYIDRLHDSQNLLNFNMRNKTNDTVTITFPTTCPNSNRNEETEEKIKTPNKIFNKKKKLNYHLMNLVNKERANTSRNNNIGSLSLGFKSRYKNIGSITKKNNWKNNINELECDFERKNFDKNLMTKNYLSKYSYYEKLSNKELKLQKALLTFRNNNTLYNAKRALEEDDDKIITKEQINNKFLVIHEGVKEKTKVVPKDDELEMLKESFVSGDETKVSIKMKSAMSKVINKYILERKKKNAKKNFKALNNEEIKQINEKNILELNYSIKNINTNISHIKELSGNKISDKFYI